MSEFDGVGGAVNEAVLGIAYNALDERNLIATGALPLAQEIVGYFGTGGEDQFDSFDTSQIQEYAAQIQGALDGAGGIPLEIVGLAQAISMESKIAEGQAAQAQRLAGELLAVLESLVFSTAQAQEAERAMRVKASQYLTSIGMEPAFRLA